MVFASDLGVHLQGRPFPVCITFDFDAESNWISRDPLNAERPVALSNGSYGARTGLARILGMLRCFHIETTFFVPGWVAEQWPDEVLAIANDGHEIAHHGYLHEWPDTLSGPEEEGELLDRGSDALEKLIGSRPRGYRSPGEFSPHTLRLLSERGFDYSSIFADRDSPYRHAPVAGGRGLIELPMQFQLDDAPFSAFSLRPSLGAGRQLYPPRLMEEIWLGEFDELKQHESNYFMLILHPQYIGRAGRMAVLRRVLQHIFESDVRFMRCEDLASEVGNVLDKEADEG